MTTTTKSSTRKPTTADEPTDRRMLVISLWPLAAAAALVAAAVAVGYATGTIGEEAEDVELPEYFAEQAAEWQTDLEIIDGPATFTAGAGITAEVLDARISNMAEAPDDVVDAMVLGEDADPPVVFNLLVRATNDTDHDIEWFTAPGLEIAGVGDVSADAWNGSWLPRDGLPAGTTSAAGLVYQLPQDVTVEELTAGEGHLDAGVPFDVDTGARLGDGLDLTFAWQPE